MSSYMGADTITSDPSKFAPYWNTQFSSMGARPELLISAVDTLANNTITSLNRIYGLASSDPAKYTSGLAQVAADAVANITAAVGALSSRVKMVPPEYNDLYKSAVDKLSQVATIVEKFKSLPSAIYGGTNVVYDSTKGTLSISMTITPPPPVAPPTIPGISLRSTDVNIPSGTGAPATSQAGGMSLGTLALIGIGGFAAYMALK